MKSLFIILIFGIAYANAQGTEFLVDNLLNPFIDNVNNNLNNYLIGQLLGQLGSILFGPKPTTARPIVVGKRDLSGLLSALPNLIKSLVEKYANQLKEIVMSFFNHSNTLPIVVQQIQNASSNLASQLFSLLENLLGSNFESIKETFLNANTIISAISQTLASILGNIN